MSKTRRTRRSRSWMPKLSGGAWAMLAIAVLPLYVAAMSLSWGIDQTAEGKVVWAELARTPR